MAPKITARGHDTSVVIARNPSQRISSECFLFRNIRLIPSVPSPAFFLLGSCGGNVIARTHTQKVRSAIRCEDVKVAVALHRQSFVSLSVNSATFDGVFTCHTSPTQQKKPPRGRHGGAATRKQIDEGDRGRPNARLVLWTFLDSQRQGHISPSPSPDHTHIHPDLQNTELCGVGGGKTGIATTLAAVS